MAFVFLNRYLDLSEAIDEGNLDALDNTDFAGTDVPFEVQLPSEQFLQEDKREEIRTWVLDISVDRKVEQVLAKDARGCYSGSLLDPSTGKQYEPCIVTGFPILQNPHNYGSRTANKEDWNKFIM